MGSRRAEELYLEFSPYQLDAGPGADAMGIGDVLLGACYRFVDQDAWPSLAVQAAVKLPAGNETDGLSSGGVDVFVAAIGTKDFDGVAATLYYGLGILDEPNGGDHEIQHGVALLAEIAIAESWSVFGELVSVCNVERDVDSFVARVGAAFHLSGNSAWDVGLTVGLDDDAPDLELFLGITWGLGKPLGHGH